MEAGKSPENMEVSGTLGRLGYKPNMGTSTNQQTEGFNMMYPLVN